MTAYCDYNYVKVYLIKNFICYAKAFFPLLAYASLSRYAITYFI